MARKRKSHKRKTHHRRKHRMGAIGGSGIGSIAGIIAGAVAGRWVAKSVLTSVDERIKNAGVIALGAFFPKLVKGDMGKAIGNGMIAAGGAGLVGNFVPALGATDTIEFPVTVGEISDNLSVVAGDDVMAGDDLQVLAGMDDDGEEY